MMDQDPSAASQAIGIVLLIVAAYAYIWIGDAYTAYKNRKHKR